MRERVMSEIPPLKDWQRKLEGEINNSNQGEVGILSIIRLCEQTYYAMEPAYIYVRDQRETVNQWLDEYRRLYFIRFKKNAPVLDRKESLSEEVLDSPTRRRTEVRSVVLELAAPGEEITDQAVLDELRMKGKRFIANNPKATVSTILFGFKSEFEKVEGKRGTFRRRIS